ncbi:hypothetical protein Peur_036258 [Populus x canadensis]
MSGTLTPRTTALVLAPAACVGIPMVLSGSMGSCAADSASVAMLRRLDSSSTAEEELGARDPPRRAEDSSLLFYAVQDTSCPTRLAGDSSRTTRPANVFCANMIDYNFYV